MQSWLSPETEEGVRMMQNPLVLERQRVIDPAATRGMSHYEWMLAKARMERALALGEFALRVAASTRAAVRSAANALFGTSARKRT
jgi:hypothetical protein